MDLTREANIGFIYKVNSTLRRQGCTAPSQMQKWLVTLHA
jgi:hypothetical protein